MKEKIIAKLKHYLKTAVMFVLNPRLLLCIGIAWLITNGWSYIMLGIGTFWGIEWMIAVSGAYLTFLWLPATPEKIVTVAIAIVLLRFLFPKDEKTLAVLRNMFSEAKAKLKRKKKKSKTEKDKAKNENPKQNPKEK